MNAYEYLQLWDENRHQLDQITTMTKSITKPDFVDEDRLQGLYRLLDETQEWAERINGYLEHELED